MNGCSIVFYLFTMFELHVIVLFPKGSLCDLLALATLSTTKGDFSCRLTLSQSSWPRSSYGNFTESCHSCVTESENASINDLCFAVLGGANLIFFHWCFTFLEPFIADFTLLHFRFEIDFGVSVGPHFFLVAGVEAKCSETSNFFLIHVQSLARNDNRFIYVKLSIGLGHFLPSNRLGRFLLAIELKELHTYHP